MNDRTVNGKSHDMKISYNRGAKSADIVVTRKRAVDQKVKLEF